MSPATGGLLVQRHRCGDVPDHLFSNNGPFSEEGNRYTARVKGDRLTMVGPARFGYEVDDECRIKCNPDGTISISWWFLDDQGEWLPWMDDKFRRLHD